MRAKPLYGEPCNRCGLCCVVSQCPVSLLAFGQREGRCPALEPDGLGGWFCGFAVHATGAQAEATKVAIGAGQGCDFAGTAEDYAAREKHRPGMVRRAHQEAAALSPEARRILEAWKAAAKKGGL